MATLAAALEAKGFDTFLPQRDGLELTRCVEALVDVGFGVQEAGRLTSKAIFALDIYQVLVGCDLLVANLNGRVPDEGTVSEASMAWSRGKPVFAFKSDSRTAFNGDDNPLVTGLFGFSLAGSIREVVESILSYCCESLPTDSSQIREEEIDANLKLGHAICDILSRSSGVADVVETIRKFDTHAAVAS